MGRLQWVLVRSFTGRMPFLAPTSSNILGFIFFSASTMTPEWKGAPPLLHWLYNASTQTDIAVNAVIVSLFSLC